MSIATTYGRAAALAALIERRGENENRERIDNSSLPAGSPMHFDCLGCGADIVVPENYTTKPKFCGECQALWDLGWLK